MSELSIANLFISYRNRDILKGVSIRFSTGLNYVIGLNGSGKSSLLKAMAGLISYRGSIQLHSRELSDYSARERARQVALLSQQLQLPFRTRVIDFVLMGRFPYLNWLGNYSKTDHQLAEQAMESMQIRSFRDRYMDELSGGEFQRVNLARALCQDSPVLLLDEPAQSLDPRSKASLYAMLQELTANHLLICATHDLDYIQPHARVLGIRDGGVVWDRQGPGERKAIMQQVYGA